MFNGFDEFDIAISTPDQMAVVGKLGRILGTNFVEHQARL